MGTVKVLAGRGVASEEGVALEGVLGTQAVAQSGAPAANRRSSGLVEVFMRKVPGWW